jgi:hypothetical protein
VVTPYDFNTYPQKTPNLPDLKLFLDIAKFLKEVPAGSQNKKGFLKFSTSISGL